MSTINGFVKPMVKSKGTKGSKGVKTSHCAYTKFGMGDNYGQGIKQKVGRNRSSALGNPVSSAKLGKPPKSLA